MYELGSLLDEVTILSITGDYDLTNPQEFAAAREVLLTISKDVEAEEATGFTPSGLGANDVVDINASNSGVGSDPTANVIESDIKSNSGFTTTTESSQPLSLASGTSSKTSTQETPALLHINFFDGLSAEEKEGQLCQMFKSLKPVDVKLALKKFKGDADLAIDELLNLQWLEETGQRVKGVDAFYVSDEEAPGKKKKAKKKKKVPKERSCREPLSPGGTGRKNVADEKHDENIAYVSERLQVPMPAVTSIYYRRNASLGATIVEIIDNYIALGVQASDDEQRADVRELANKYSWVPREYISGILDICPTRQFALDLTTLLGDYFEKPSYVKYGVSYSTIASKPGPVTASSDNAGTSKAQLTSKFTSPRSPTGGARKHTASISRSFGASSTELAAARDHSYTSAASAFRKGKSNPLFRQAGAYYAERGREQASIYHQAVSMEAEYIVDQKSTRDMVDLHGVTVQDGVDIALDRVWRWWEGLGEDRAWRAKEGFTVVTGLGRHNPDGRSPLRINVFKALIADGWKVEVLTAAVLLAGHARADELYTPKHEAGRCAMRGHCGKKGFFGKQLPCLDNGLATTPDDDFAQQIVAVCGEKWKGSKVCCDAEQIESLKSELSTPNQIIGSCPACKDNFYNLFCTFSCSPDQSLFLNVTDTLQKNGKTLVTEVDQLVSEEYGEGFYNSCKDVKFGASNSRAMNFIGGGATNYTQLLKFLGDEKPIGSPFQINFPTSYSEPHMAPRDMKPKKCNDEDPNYRCACVDCPDVCPKLPDVQEAGSCRVGVLPCLTFASIFTYSVLLFTLLVGLMGHIAWQRYTRRRHEGLQLLQGGAEPSDDEDEGDLVLNPAMRDRPVKHYKINTWCDIAFSKLGHICARFPASTIFASLLVVIVLSLGWVKFDVEKEPARLWVSPTSAAAQEKAFFDENFGPFYRAEKAFLVNDTHGPVLSYETLTWWSQVEKDILQLKGADFDSTFNDVCFKPTGSACVVQSPTIFFDGTRDWKKSFQECAETPVFCRPDFGQPIDPNMIMGGYGSLEDVTEAPAMTVTWVVNNHLEGSPELAHAMDWERSLRDRLLEAQKEATDRGLRLSFSTEISLEQELNKSTNSDATIIVISYLVMFLYASLALGSTSMTVRDLIRNPAVALVQSKFTLGFVGILIVLMSITSSIGLFSWAGIKATLIIAEVIPFIVLAVGVDNIFLIVHEFERVNVSHPDAMVEERISKALGRMGPSILFSAITETVSFALGAFVGMPAVRNFAIYAAGAVFINALLQMTLFVSILSYNQIRTEDHRADCFPCIHIKAARVHLNGSNGHAGSYPYDVPEESFLQQFIRKHYAPALLGKKVKALILVIFTGLLATGVALIPYVKLGLDQRVALPDDSYLIDYFNDLYDYLDTGPPVYFVAKDLNATQHTYQRDICSRFTTCEQLSLTNVLEQERKRPDVSYISSPTASWIDDFFLWLKPENDACCTEDRKVCFEDRQPAWNVTLHGMPEGEEFVHYLQKFLTSPTNEECPLAGQASYSQAVVVDVENTNVPASHFRTSHKPLRSQDDFINAYQSARRIANEVSSEMGIEVFPYSVFYVFFDQYADIIQLTATLLGSAVAIIFAVSTVLLGSILTALVVTITVVMTVVDIIGAMAAFDVSLNAVSLVNLIICVGIAVEFCAHIARAFMFPSESVMEHAKNRFRGRDARAWTALVNVGGSVFSGITVTKLLGVFVLAFTRSKIFEIYYFRVWLALVVFAAAHALVLLPVLLSLFGGEGYVDPESEGGLVEDLANRRYRALVPDDDDDDEGSDDDDDGHRGYRD
ncbi:hypothetical protein DL770_001048 [Monosporascus sp. CRB-9-2]|nr:hypothetical protein DL770_001048 [Monosporascus sp. CRB-9-2]